LRFLVPTTAPRILDFKPGCNMNKPTKTAAELEALIRLEMGRLCPMPRSTVVSVRPDAGTWRVFIVRGGSDDEAYLDIIHLVARRLRTEFDLEG
jgi:hypothetical protein